MSRSRLSLVVALAVPALAAVATLAAVPLPPAAMAAPAGGLEGFLAPMRTCAPGDGTAPFDLFARSLAERYRNPFSAKPRPSAVHAEVRVAVPAGLSGAIGPEEVVNHGEYTAVTVPLTGTFGGVALKALQFSFGNENGISVAGLIFAAPQAAVVKAFGRSVARGAAQGAKAGEDVASYSAAIPEVEPGRIICDWST